jgi:hypothetical protein
VNDHRVEYCELLLVYCRGLKRLIAIKAAEPLKDLGKIFRDARRALVADNEHQSVRHQVESVRGRRGATFGDYDLPGELIQCFREV